MSAFLIKKTEFNRRVNNWSDIEAAINEIPADVRLSDQDLLNLGGGRWSAPVFTTKHWPLLAFRAFLEGQLSEKAITKLLLYHACLQEGSVETFQLLDGAKKVDLAALRTLEHFGNSVMKGEKIFCHLGASNIEPLDTQFFRVTHRPAREDSLFFGLLCTGSHPGLRLENNRYVQLVLPPDLLNSVLEAHFGSHARKALPVLGHFVTKERLSDLLRRPVSISFEPYINVPKESHGGYLSTPLSFYQHDAMHHLWIDSVNIHRKTWVALAHHFRGQGLIEEAITCLDGDFEPYAKSLWGYHEKGSPDDLFWYTVFMTYDDEKIDTVLKFLRENKELAPQLFDTIRSCEELYPKIKRGQWKEFVSLVRTTLAEP